MRGNGNLSANKSFRNFGFKLVLGVVLHAESISGIRFAMMFVLGELRAVEVVKTTSAGSTKYTNDKNA